MYHSKWKIGNIPIDVGYIAEGTYPMTNIAPSGSTFWSFACDSFLPNANCYMGTRFKLWNYINNSHPAYNALMEDIQNRANTRAFICKIIAHDTSSGYYWCACIFGYNVAGSTTFAASAGFAFIKDTNTISETAFNYWQNLTDKYGFAVGIRPRSGIPSSVPSDIMNSFKYELENLYWYFINNTGLSSTSDTLQFTGQNAAIVRPLFFIANNVFTQVTNYNQFIYTVVLYAGGRQMTCDQIIGGATSDGDTGGNFNPYNPLPPNPEDPYDPEPPDDEGDRQDGGDGDRGDESDPIPEPDLPTRDAVSTGFVKLYRPGNSEIQSLSSFLWSGLFDLDTLKKLFSDPMDVIMGLSIFPIQPDIGGQKHIILGNIDTEITCDYISAQYKTFDCGSIDLKEYYGSYLDYDPYTSIRIYLPYIGYQYISPDYAMLKTISVKYKVDFLTGSCAALVIINGNVEYQFSGNMAAQIPITSQNYADFMLSMIQSVIQMSASIAIPPSTGGIMGSPEGANAATSAVSNLIGQKIHYAHGGAVTGVAGHMTVRKPYLLIEFPEAIVPPDQNSYTGYPAYFNEHLIQLSGFTQVAEIQLSCPGATDEEYEEIITLLKQGVII